MIFLVVYRHCPKTMNPTAPAITVPRILGKSTSLSTTKKLSISSTNSQPLPMAHYRPPSSVSFKAAQAAKSKVASLTKPPATSLSAKNHLASGATKLNLPAPTPVLISPK